MKLAYLQMLAGLLGDSSGPATQFNATLLGQQLRTRKAVRYNGWLPMEHRNKSGPAAVAK